MNSVIAVDLGGTKLSAVVVDETGRVLERIRRRVEAVDFNASVRQVADVIHEMMRQRQTGVGLIVPGIYFPSSGNAWAPNLWGHEQVPLRQELERVMPLPVVIDSDRAGYVIGERWQGAARRLGRCGVSFGGDGDWSGHYQRRPFDSGNRRYCRCGWMVCAESAASVYLSRSGLLGSGGSWSRTCAAIERSVRGRSRRRSTAR